MLHLPSGPVTPWVWEQDIYGYSIPVWAIYIGCAVAMPILKSILHRTISEVSVDVIRTPMWRMKCCGSGMGAVEMLLQFIRFMLG